MTTETLIDTEVTEVTEIPSPCINICKLDEKSGLCQGCFRTRNEIASWRGASNDGRLRILAAVERRRSDYDPFGSAAGGSQDQLRGECER